MKTYFEQMIDSLKKIEEKFSVFIGNVSIRQFKNDPYSGVFILTHEFFYDTNLSEDQKKRQIEILKDYAEWEEHFNLLTLNMPDDISKEIKKCEEFLRKQIDLKSDWGTESTPDKNYKKIQENLQKLQSILKLLCKDEITVLIPDTNSLILDPEFEKYKNIAGDEISIIISPTVLWELDKLKITHRDENFRNKVDSVIKRIKGLRSQGSLIQGITVNKTITIKMSAREPDFMKTLSWLDPNNDDDRIIAFSLECLRENPAQKIILITSDINLQNKSEMAKLPYSEPPTKI